MLPKQEQGIVEQLTAGIRYFDLRIAHKPRDISNDLYFFHVIYTHVIYTHTRHIHTHTHTRHIDTPTPQTAPESLPAHTHTHTHTHTHHTCFNIR